MRPRVEKIAELGWAPGAGRLSRRPRGRRRAARHTARHTAQKARNAAWNESARSSSAPGWSDSRLRGALARAGHDTLVLEAAERIGSGISSRNSEVIHAGLYYPAGSLKARLCVAGRAALYEFCAARGVPYRRTGKLIIAREPRQVGELEAIEVAARAAGVTDLQRLDSSEARALEPALDCAAALLSPSTGIVDSQALMLALLAEAEASGATLACGASVRRVERRDGFVAGERG